MRTKLPDEIKNVDEAKFYLIQLISNKEIYHPEEDALEAIWSDHNGTPPTELEAIQMNKLMYDIYNLQECQSDDKGITEFDPCLFVAENYKLY